MVPNTWIAVDLSDLLDVYREELRFFPIEGTGGVRDACSRILSSAHPEHCLIEAQSDFFSAVPKEYHDRMDLYTEFDQLCDYLPADLEAWVQGECGFGLESIHDVRLDRQYFYLGVCV